MVSTGPTPITPKELGTNSRRFGPVPTRRQQHRRRRRDGLVDKTNNAAEALV
jgi:hypothetical protein